jgi:predicted nuclease of predicted toxin-antitoxin system
MLGVEFGQKKYILTILKDVEDEVRRNRTLSFKYPWFDNEHISAERLAKQIRHSAEERAELEIVQSVIHGSVLSDVVRYMTSGRSPPSNVDCKVLALAQLRSAIVVTDDLGMHLLASDFGIPVWHGHQLLSKMLSAQMVTKELVREIFQALEDNGDLTETWKASKHTTFSKVFGKQD